MTFILFRIFFSDITRELEYLFFLSRQVRIFFPNLTLGYMTKTLNQIICFPPPKSDYFFQQHWESEYFLENGPSLITIIIVSCHFFFNLGIFCGKTIC